MSFLQINQDGSTPLLTRVTDLTGTRVLAIDATGTLRRIPISSFPANAPLGAELPASPVVGEVFILTQDHGDNIAGWYVCLTAGEWSHVAGSGGSGYTYVGVVSEIPASPHLAELIKFKAPVSELTGFVAMDGQTSVSAAAVGDVFAWTGSVWQLQERAVQPRGAGGGLGENNNYLYVDTGNGLEIEGEKVRVKLNGPTLTRSNAGLKLSDIVARDRGGWSASTSYIVGDIVSQGGSVYRCKTANSDATFTVSKWDDLTASVAARGAGTGLTLNGNNLDVTNPFTDEDETKLDGVAAGAQVNPLNIVRFSASSGDTADGVADGLMGLYLNNALVQSGEIDQVTHIDIADANANYDQNPTQPGVDPSAVETARFFGDKADNGGSFKMAITKRGTTSTVWVQVDSIVAKTGGWRLSGLDWFGTTTVSGVNDIWNITAGTDAVFTDDVVDLPSKLSKYVTRQDLEGHEADQFASYNNSLFGSGYFPGNFCLFTGSTQPTDDTNAIGQPDIVSGSGVIVFGDLRADSDPDAAFTPEALVAADFPSGKVIHISPWDPYKPSAYLIVTLTADATIVGTGNGQHAWAPATWVEVGNVADVVSDGDYFRWSEDTPSQLKFDLPYQAIGNPPWLLAPTADATALSQTTPVLVEQDGVSRWVTIAHLNEHLIPKTTEPAEVSAVYKVSQANVGDGNGTLNVTQNPLNLQQITVYWAIEGTEDLIDGGSIPRSDILAYFTQHHKISITGGSGVLNGNIQSFSKSPTQDRWIIALGPGSTLTGSFPSDGTVTVRLRSNLVNRDEFADVAFDGSYDDLSDVPAHFRGAWAASTAYLIGDIVTRSGEVYQCKTANSDASFTASKWYQLTATGLPEQSGHGGQFLKTDGTSADWADASFLNFYDSGDLTDSASRTVSDTDAVQASTLTESGVIETEDITNFGRVYKTAALKSLVFDYNFNATVGVAFQLRYSDTKPTASSDAKSFGTQCAQVSVNTDGRCVEFDTPANRYWWFALSGGGSRTVNKRDLRVRAAYEASGAAGGDITGVTASNGLTGGGSTGTVSLAVQPDGDTLSVSSSGVRLGDSVARDRGAWVASTSYIVGDVVTRSGSVYRCKTANSDASFTASKWDNLSVDTDTNTQRGAGEGLKLNGNDLYVDTGNGTEINNDKVVVKLNGPTLTRSNAGLKLSDSVARDRGAWAASTAYVVGDVVSRSGSIYRCKTANSDASFTASKWDNLSVGDTNTQRGAGTGLTLNGNNLDVTNPFTDADESKLDGIAAGAEVNVKSDWDATSGDAQILNKPTIPTVPARAGAFTAADETKLDNQQESRAYVIRSASDGDYTVVAADDGKVIFVNTSTAARTVNLPDLGSGDTGFEVVVIKESALNTLTVDPNGSDNVDGQSTYVLSGNREAVRLRWNSAAWDVVAQANRASDFSIATLTAESAPQLGDEVALYDGSASAMRKMTLENLSKGIDFTKLLNSPGWFYAYFQNKTISIASPLDGYDPVNKELLRASGASLQRYTLALGNPGGGSAVYRSLNSGNTSVRGVVYDAVNQEYLVLDITDRVWYRYNSSWVYQGTRSLNTGNTDARDITIDTLNNEVLVLDATDRAWYRYNLDGTYIGMVSLDSSQASARGIVYIPGNDEVYVNDSYDDNVVRYERDGTVVGSFSLANGGPEHMFLVGNDLYVSEFFGNYRGAYIYNRILT